MPDEIRSQLEQIGNQALTELQEVQSLDQLEKIRVGFLGKKGALSEVLKGLGSLPADQRPQVGALANEWKRKIESALQEKLGRLQAVSVEKRLQSEALDVSLPSVRKFRGSSHVLTQTTRRILKVFTRLGFDVATGPEVETDYLTFEAVNIPADHPARDMQDTFFLGPGVVLRTHTTPVQMRAMLNQKWPVRVLSPGAVYRCDSDATHSPMFHQVEGLWVDEGVRMSDLKGVLEYFAKEIFGEGSQIRLRPSYFPFVEPGAEVDVICFNCKGKQATCSVCKGSGWIEILGAGMVHPFLFEQAGYPQDKVSGFAFGLGVERIAMLLHKISDIRLFYDGDVRFHSQF